MPYLGLGRDPSRTPMRWNAGPGADFTHGEPWLPVGDDLERVNVNVESEDPGSMLTLYRRLIALRRETPALLVGGFRILHADDAVIAYERESEGRRFLVALNFSAEPRRLDLGVRGRLVLSSEPGRAEGEQNGALELQPHEGRIVEVTA
jgi:alpha-glucosidase